MEVVLLINYLRVIAWVRILRSARKFITKLSLMRKFTKIT